MTPTELFDIGKIVKSCGFKGRLKAVSYLESHDTLRSLDEVYVRRGKDETGPFTVRAIRTRGKSFFLEIEGVEDGKSAQAIVGCELMIEAGRLKKLSEDEYYWRDIIGLKVVTEDGHVLGTVEAILPTGSNDVYVVGGAEREILLPGIADVVRKIDIDQGTMVVKLLAGL